MKNKTPLILGSIFLLLVVFFIVTSIKSPEKVKGTYSLFEDEKPSIDKIELMKVGKEHIVLEEQNGIWNITKPFKYKANEPDVSDILIAISNIHVDGIISNRVEAWEQFNVTDSTGTVLKAYSKGNIILDAIVGKSSTQLGHTYARMAGSNETVLWRGPYAMTVKRSASEWRDKSIYSFNEGDIIALKAIEEGKTRELALADSIWIYTENGKEKPVSQDNVKQLVSLIASLNADGFADEYDMGNITGRDTDTRVTFTVRNGDSHIFDVWTPTEKDPNKRYLIRKENGDVIFRFYTYRGSQLVIDYEKIKAEE